MRDATKSILKWVLFIVYCWAATYVCNHTYDLELPAVLTGIVLFGFAIRGLL